MQTVKHENMVKSPKICALLQGMKRLEALLL